MKGVGTFLVVLLAAHAAVSAIKPAKGQDWHLNSGNHFYELCRGDAGSAPCEHYVMGVLDMLYLALDYELSQGRTDMGQLCLPDDITVTQVTDAVMDHMESYPDDRHWRFIQVVVQVLTAAGWYGNPCDG